MRSLGSLRAFISDMDGVVYRGNAVIPGAPEFFGRLRAAGIPFVFLTNNGTTPADQVAERLLRMGITVRPDEIITSAEATAAAVQAEMPGARVIMLGEEGVRRALIAAGLRLVDDYRQADVAVASLDRQMTYARLRDVALAIRRGIPFFATNADLTLPAEDGNQVPGAGTLVGALELATGVRARVIGKPAPGFFHYALQRLGSSAECTAAIGDRIETDILGGQRAGLPTIGVLTGVSTAAEFAALQPPADWVFPDLYALADAYFGWAQRQA